MKKLEITEKAWSSEKKVPRLLLGMMQRSKYVWAEDTTEDGGVLVHASDDPSQSRPAWIRFDSVEQAVSFIKDHGLVEGYKRSVEDEEWEFQNNHLLEGVLR